MAYKVIFRVLWFSAFCLLSVLIMADIYWYLESYKKPLYSNRKDYHPLRPIKSPNCEIPTLDPFENSLKKFIVKVPSPVPCSSRPALTEVTHDESTDESRLQINSSAASHYSKDLPLRCCAIPFYSELHINANCQYFTKSLVIAKEAPFLAVYCYDSRSVNVYKNIHAAVVKSNTSTMSPKDKLSRLNVLLLGFDSVSRLNMHRTMPLTVEFLETEGWIEMKGYNKIEDNTLPNLMAILTGLPPGSYPTSHDTHFDSIPFIWKDFSSAGYVTAYAEDTPNIDTFDCHMMGFRKPPTDHYARNFFVAGERHFMNDPGTCIGYKSPSEHLFSYILDYVAIYKESPFFGLFWVNHFSHNNLNIPSSVDKNVLQFLRQLKSLGTFNNTIIAFFSDHGLRISSFRQTRIGWYEDRLPFLFISLPEWYKLHNQNLYANILKNSGKLTTPYDLYLTLRHILSRFDFKKAGGCVSCTSMLREMPSDRSCTSVGISPHWCSCQDAIDLNTTSPFVLELAELIIPVLNDKVVNERTSAGYYCATLKLHRVLYARRKFQPADNQYILAIEVRPGEAKFEATIIEVEQGYVVDKSMSRINEYRDTSHCVVNAYSKHYCYCLNHT